LVDCRRQAKLCKWSCRMKKTLTISHSLIIYFLLLSVFLLPFYDFALFSFILGTLILHYFLLRIMHRFCSKNLISLVICCYIGMIFLLCFFCMPNEVASSRQKARQKLNYNFLQAIYKTALKKGATICLPTCFFRIRL